VALEKKWITNTEELDESYIRGINSVAKMESFYLPSLSLGPYKLNNIPVIIPTEGESTNIAKKAFSSGFGKTLKGK
jgi:hypothetical protein